MKNNFDTHVCHVPIASSSSIDKHVGCSTLSSSIKSDICMLKKSVGCLGFILNLFAIDHKKLESMFLKKQVSHIHAH